MVTTSGALVDQLPVLVTVSVPVTVDPQSTAVVGRPDHTPVRWAYGSTHCQVNVVTPPLGPTTSATTVVGRPDWAFSDPTMVATGIAVPPVKTGILQVQVWVDFASLNLHEPCLTLEVTAKLAVPVCTGVRMVTVVLDVAAAV